MRKFKVFVAVEELPCGEFFVVGTRVVKPRARQKVARSIRKRANCGKRRRSKGNLTYNCHSYNRERRDTGGLKACIGCKEKEWTKDDRSALGEPLHKSEGKKYLGSAHVAEKHVAEKHVAGSDGRKGGKRSGERRRRISRDRTSRSASASREGE